MLDCWWFLLLPIVGAFRHELRLCSVFKQDASENVAVVLNSSSARDNGDRHPHAHPPSPGVLTVCRKQLVRRKFECRLGGGSIFHIYIVGTKTPNQKYLQPLSSLIT